MCLTGKSDPYVKIKLGMGQEVKTKHKKGNLNPRFDQTFDLLVYEPSVEVGDLCDGQFFTCADLHSRDGCYCLLQC